MTGAAWATTISRGIGALYSLSYLVRGVGRVNVHKRHLALHPEVGTRPRGLHVRQRNGMMHGYAVGCLRTVSRGFLLYAFGIVVTQSFNGAGNTGTPTWINFMVFCALAGVSTVVFRRGHGKTKTV